MRVMLTLSFSPLAHIFLGKIKMIKCACGMSLGSGLGLSTIALFNLIPFGGPKESEIDDTNAQKTNMKRCLC